jgi:hypothetical protein
MLIIISSIFTLKLPLFAVAYICSIILTEEGSMTHFRIDVARETGQITLFMEMPCGAKPVLGWPNTDGMKEFACMLLNLCENIETTDKSRDIRNRLLEKSIRDFTYISKPPNN